MKRSLPWVFLVLGGFLMFGLLRVVDFSILVEPHPPVETQNLLTPDSKVRTSIHSWSQFVRRALGFKPSETKERKGRRAQGEGLRRDLVDASGVDRLQVAKALQVHKSPENVWPILLVIRAGDSDARELLSVAHGLLLSLPEDVQLQLMIYGTQTYDSRLVPESQEFVLLQLERLGALELDFLRETLASSGNPLWRCFAVRQLAAFRPPHMGALTAALADPDASVRLAAQDALDNLVL